LYSIDNVCNITDRYLVLGFFGISFHFKVRNNVKNRSGPIYSPNDLEKTVNADKCGSFTYNQAYEEFNVLIAVVYNRKKVN